MHTYFHTAFGFCLWDLLALLVLIAIVVLLAAHVYRQHKREKDFEDQLAEKEAATQAAANGAPAGKP